MKEVTKKKKWIVIFLAPGMLLFVFIFLISMVQLGITSFTDWSIGADPVFSGLANYIYLLQKTATSSEVFSIQLYGLRCSQLCMYASVPCLH